MDVNKNNKLYKLKYCDSFVKKKIWNLLDVTLEEFFNFENFKKVLKKALNENVAEKLTNFSYNVSSIDINGVSLNFTINNQDDLNKHSEDLLRVLENRLPKIEYKFNLPNPGELIKTDESLKIFLLNGNLYLKIIALLFMERKNNKLIDAFLKDKQLNSYFKTYLKSDQVAVLLELCYKIIKEQYTKLKMLNLKEDKNKYALDDEFEILINNDENSLFNSFEEISIIEQNYEKEYENFKSRSSYK